LHRYANLNGKPADLGSLRVSLTQQLFQYKTLNVQYSLTPEESHQASNKQLTSIDYWTRRPLDPKCQFLADVAICFFKVITTEAAVERSFSHFSFLHSKERNRLCDNSLRSEMILRFNCIHPLEQFHDSSQYNLDEILSPDLEDENDTESIE
jgi:hypothetical protein